MKKAFESMLFFDWYCAAVDVDSDLFMSVFQSDHEWLHIEPSRPRNGYERAYSFVGGDGVSRLTVMYGGASQGTKINCTATGEYADAFAMWIRERFPDHELVRADVAVDYNEHAAWASLHGLGVTASGCLKLKNRYVGPSGLETALGVAEGRTLYVGSRQSVSFVRIYEKGKKDNKEYPDWVRVEFEFKPQTAAARHFYASASHASILSSTKLGRFLLAQLGNASTVCPCAPGTVRGKSSHEKTIDYIADKFAASLAELYERCNGDSAAFCETLLRHNVAAS